MYNLQSSQATTRPAAMTSLTNPNVRTILLLNSTMTTEPIQTEVPHTLLSHDFVTTWDDLSQAQLSMQKPLIPAWLTFLSGTGGILCDLNQASTMRMSVNLPLKIV